MITQNIIGVAASICTGVSLIPQLVKIIIEKKAEDVSLVMLLVLFAGLGLWTYYGILKDDLIIIVSNSFSLMVNLLILIFILKNWKGKLHH